LCRIVEYLKHVYLKVLSQSDKQVKMKISVTNAPFAKKFFPELQNYIPSFRNSLFTKFQLSKVYFLHSFFKQVKTLPSCFEFFNSDLLTFGKPSETRSLTSSIPRNFPTTCPFKLLFTTLHGTYIVEFKAYF
jgi:hypothetical protein